MFNAAVPIQFLDEVYNLSAQSKPQCSFIAPFYQHKLHYLFFNNDYTLASQISVYVPFAHPHLVAFLSGYYIHRYNVHSCFKMVAVVPSVRRSTTMSSKDMWVLDTDVSQENLPQKGGPRQPQKVPLPQTGTHTYT